VAAGKSEGERLASAKELDRMHHSATRIASFANSVKTDVTAATSQRRNHNGGLWPGSQGGAFAVRSRDDSFSIEKSSQEP
jgi:hypothetical protein